MRGEDGRSALRVRHWLPYILGRACCHSRLQKQWSGSAICSSGNQQFLAFYGKRSRINVHQLNIIQIWHYLSLFSYSRLRVSRGLFPTVFRYKNFVYNSRLAYAHREYAAVRFITFYLKSRYSRFVFDVYCKGLVTTKELTELIWYRFLLASWTFDRLTHSRLNFL
jgi:hypothetical protein